MDSITVIDVTSITQVPKTFIGYVCEPSPESAAAKHFERTGQKPDRVYRRVNSMGFTTLYIETELKHG